MTLFLSLTPAVAMISGTYIAVMNLLGVPSGYRFSPGPTIQSVGADEIAPPKK